MLSTAGWLGLACGPERPPLQDGRARERRVGSSPTSAVDRGELSHAPHESKLFKAILESIGDAFYCFWSIDAVLNQSGSWLSGKTSMGSFKGKGCIKVDYMFL